MNESGRIFLTFVGGGLIMMLAGCALGPTRLEADYGRSAQLATANQILDPTAQQNLAPVYGFDGKAAEGTLDKYRATFEKPTPPPTFVIPVGSTR
jgi:hypothetical protein